MTAEKKTMPVLFSLFAPTTSERTYFNANWLGLQHYTAHGHNVNKAKQLALRGKGNLAVGK